MHISQFGHVDNMQFELYMRPTTGSRRKNLEGLVQPCVLCVSVIWIVSADGIILKFCFLVRIARITHARRRSRLRPRGHCNQINNAYWLHHSRGPQYELRYDTKRQLWLATERNMERCDGIVLEETCPCDCVWIDYAGRTIKNSRIHFGCVSTEVRHPSQWNKRTVLQHFICVIFHRTAIVFRQPPLSSIENIFILPLSGTVWVCCICLMFVIFGIMLCQALHPFLIGKMSVYDAATFVWGAVCQHGTNLEFPSISSRLAVLTTFLSFLAIFTSYSANIVALLQSASNSIKTIEDLIRSPLMLSIQEAGYNHYLYQETNNALVKRVYEKKVKPQGDAGWIYNAFVGIERMRTEPLAFHLETKSAYKAIGMTFTASEKCSLSELQLVELPMTTFFLEKMSPHKELYRQR